MQRANSLYIHIPFCAKKCDYCDFFSLPVAKDCTLAVPDNYIEALIKEITFYVQQCKITVWKSIYIGGGTPSLLNAAQITKLMNAVWKLVGGQDENTEVTMEMNPESVREDLLLACAKNGINRISLGVQSLNDDSLASVHRIATKKMTLKALLLLSDCWKKRLSVDLIAGLPKETATTFKNGLEIICSFPLEHISLYSLTVEENTPFGKSVAAKTALYDPDKADKIWLSGRSFLERHGFYQYEVSNFSRSDCESVHNCAYWRLESYIGCGAGATGSLYGLAHADGSEGCADGIRWTNTTDIARYIAFWTAASGDGLDMDTIPRQKEILTSDMQRFEFLMMGFRTKNGVSSQRYKTRFNANLEKVIGASDGVFARWQEQRLARVTSLASGDDYYALNKRGILLLNRFLEELMPDLPNE